MELTYKGNLNTLVRAVNIAELMGPEDRQKVGQHCLEGFTRDKATRAQWEEWYADSIKMALQIKQTKSFPWPNCSNIKFPLITIACLYFHAKAYPALIGDTEIVKCKPVGTKRTAEYEERCSRVGAHMSYQLLEETDWEDTMDRGLLILPLLGTILKKTYFNPVTKVRTSELISPEFFVVDYYTGDLRDCRRTSEMFVLHKNDVRTRVRSGRWLDVFNTDPQPSIGPIENIKERGSMTTTPTDTQYYPMIEQNCWLDLDKDGYEEPYVITFRQDTGQLARIVARWFPTDVEKDSNGKVIAIRAYNPYTKVPFIPSPDGSFYELGFGRLLGPVNESIDSIINQLVDAGTMSNLGGGFLGRGAKIKGGETTFKPFEWKRVDSTGDDLRKNIVELTVREPSLVLLQLLTFLVNYGQQVAGATDTQVGENPGQNTPAETMRIMNQNGKQIYTATYKRIWRAMKNEFKAFYRINALYPENLQYEDKQTGKWFDIQPGDYSYPDSGIVPAADPNMVSSLERQQQAIMTHGVVAQTPGGNLMEAGRRVLAAFNIPDIDKLLPPPMLPDGQPNPEAIQPPPDPKLLKVELEQLKEQNRQAEAAAQDERDTIKLYSDLELAQAKVAESQAKVILMMEEAATIQDDSEIAKMNTQIGMAKLELEGHKTAVKLITDVMKEKMRAKTATRSGGSSKT